MLRAWTAETGVGASAATNTIARSAKVAGTLRVPSADHEYTVAGPRLLKKPAAGAAGRTEHGVCLLLFLP
jgi:hypothetical protein